MTFGLDVARGIKAIIGNSDTLAKFSYHIFSIYSMGELLNIFKSIRKSFYL